MNPRGMVWWRFKRAAPCEWRFGYASSVNRELTRMGCWNGDTGGGVVVSTEEIEWKPY
jgi:hypothetical protein